MRILYHSIRFVNTKISGSVPELATQPIQLKSTIRRFIFCISAVVLTVVGSANHAEAQRTSTSVSDVLSSETDAEFARALEPITLEFPRDHGAHPEYQIEWWYYTGNLHTDDGQAFGYQLTFFRFCVDTPNARADFTFRDEPSLHGAFRHYGCREQRTISVLSVGVGGQEDWRARREIQPTRSGWKIGLP